MVSHAATGHKNPARQKSRLKPQDSAGSTHFMRRLFIFTLQVLIITSLMVTSPAQAGDVGPVTKLPMPRYVSLKAAESNVRRGPSLTHRIDWVFKHRDMPLRITAEHGHWRRVEDRDGMGGWVHYSLLSGVRTVLVEQHMLSLHARPDPKAPVTVALELGVVARLGDCDAEWCELRTGGYRGWAPKARIWGVAPGEIRD